MNVERHFDLVNVWGLSRRLNLPVAWLRNEAIEGRIPALRVGRHLRFNVIAVERALAARAAQRQQGPGDGEGQQP